MVPHKQDAHRQDFSFLEHDGDLDDTGQGMAGETLSPNGLPILKAGDEPFPGYRLIEPLGRGGFGEVWKCAVPGGLVKAIKFVHNDSEPGAEGPVEQERDALERIKAIRHPFLLTMERIEVVGGTLVIVMELADRSLQELRQEYQQTGLPGIPREELLHLLGEAAEILDVLNVQHGLQHLDVKPCNLFLVYNHVKVGDYGLVDSLEQHRLRGKSENMRGLTPLYVACERLKGAISQHSDQYSLAVVYQDLLTGIPPFQGRNARQVFLQHVSAEPDLSPLPPGDRAVVARALAKNPDRRFPSCSAFIQALRNASALAGPVEANGSRQSGHSLSSQAETPLMVPVIRNALAGSVLANIPREATPAVEPIRLAALEKAGVCLAPIVRVEAAQVKFISECPGLPTVQQFVHGALLFGAGLEQMATDENFRYAHRSRQGLEYLCTVRPALEALQQKFREFCAQWKAEPQFPSDTLLLCRLNHPRSLWKKWLGWKNGLEIRVELQPIKSPAPEIPVGREAVIKIRAFGEGQASGPARFEEVGPLLLQNLLSHLPTHSDRRMETRWPFLPPLQVYPVTTGGHLGEMTAGLCRDLSLTGIGFWLLQPPTAEHIFIRLSTLQQLQSFAVLARIVRARTVNKDRYEIGAEFLMTSSG